MLEVKGKAELIKIETVAEGTMYEYITFDIQALFESEDDLKEAKKRIVEYVPDYLWFFEYYRRYAVTGAVSVEEKAKIEEQLSKLSNEEKAKLKSDWGMSSQGYIKVEVNLHYGYRPSESEWIDYHIENLDSIDESGNGKWTKTEGSGY